MSIGTRTDIFLRRAVANRAALDEKPQPGEPVVGSSEPRAPTILALVDLTADDGQVVDVAGALAGAHRATVVLLHVARPFPRGRRAWRAMGDIEAAAQRAMRRLAGRWLSRSLLVQISVRFGDATEQVAKAMMAVGAMVVVAASRPGRWPRRRDRDQRLRQHLDVPVILVRGHRGEPDRRRGLTREKSSGAERTQAAA